MLSPLIGIIASSGGAAGGAASYESIATTTVGSGGASSITFSSIPATYTHLQIRYLARTTSGGIGVFNCQINSIGTASYAYHRLSGNGTAASAYAQASVSEITDTFLITGTTSTFSSGIIDILDYANTNKYKTLRSITGVDINGSGQIIFASGLVQTTNAMTSIVFVPSVNFAEYTQFALYGIKGA